MRPSMGSLGDCYDNAHCEIFFATLACPLIDHRHRTTGIAKNQMRRWDSGRMAAIDAVDGSHPTAS